MKFWGILLLFGSIAASAQTTTISATVTDSDAQTWNYGTWKADFVVNQAYPQESSYKVAGNPVSQNVLHQKGQMTSGGALATTIYDSSLTTPAGSMWSITVCPQASAPCGVYLFASSGASMNLTSPINAIIKAPRFNAIAGTYGYNDTEAMLTFPVGATYWSSSSSCQRLYNVNTTTWACSTGGGDTGGNLPGPQFAVGNYALSGTQTTVGPSGVSVVGSTLGGLSTTDTSFQFMKQPFGTANPGTGFCAGTGYFSQNIADQVTCNIYTTHLPILQGYTGYGWFDWLLDGGTNENQNGYNSKPGTNMFSLISQNNTQGSLNNFNINSYQYSNGDNFNIFNIVTCYGGTSAQGDEGCENNDEWMFEGTQEFTATIASVSGTGATTLVLNSPSIGNGTDGTGRYVIDVSNGTITAGTITALTGGGTPITATGSGTSWPVSTVNTTASTPASWVPGVATITPASMSGISVGTVLCVTTGGDFDIVKVTATPGGNSFTATFNHPNAAGALITAGGLCGYGIGFNSDNINKSGYSGTMRWIFPVIRSTSSTSLDFWNGHAGNYSQGYTGTWNSTTNNTYTLYPLAEMLHVNNGTNNLSSTVNVSANNIAWAPGDTIEEPIYFTLTTQHGNNNYFRTFPSGQMVGRTYQFGGQGWASTIGIAGVGTAATFEKIVNANPDVFYGGTTNNRFAPNGTEFFGPWSNLLFLDRPPVDALLVGNVGASGSLETVTDFTSTGGWHDHFFYVGTDHSKGTGYWGFSTNGGENGNTGPFVYIQDGSIVMSGGVIQMDSVGNLNTTSSVSTIGAGFGGVQNLLSDSQFQTFGTYWSTGCGMVSATPNTTDVLDPVGGNTAVKLVGAATSPGGGCGSEIGILVQGNVSVVTGHTYAAILTLRGAVGGETGQLNIPGAGGPGFIPPITLSTSWKSFPLIFTASVTSSTKQFIWDMLTPGSATVYAADAQLCDLSASFPGCVYIWTNPTPVSSYLGFTLKGINVPTLTLTTAGTNGAATYNAGTGVLNIPTYSANGTAGIATMASGTITVSNSAACVASGSTCKYKFTNCGLNASTAIGVPSLGTVSAGTSFIINSLTATGTVATGDASSICWQIN